MVTQSIRHNTSEVHRALGLLLAHESLVLQVADVLSAAVAQLQSKPTLSFFDCLGLEIARKAGHLPLGSFDKALAKLDGVQKLQVQR